MKLIGTIVVLAMLGSAPGAAATDPQRIQSVVTFGDSWSDAGTFGTVYGTTPGSSWSQLLARKYGDDQTAYVYVSEGKTHVLGGLNYAQGGAKTAVPAKPEGPADSIPNSAVVQVENYKRAYGRFRGDQLVVLWIGTNDILAPFASGGAFSDADVDAMNSDQAVTAAVFDAAAANVRRAVREQINLVQAVLVNGASHLVVINCPDMGWATFQPGTRPAGLRRATQLTSLFNTSLAAGLPHDPRVLLVDADGLLKRAAAPGAGFTHVPDDACANGSTVCGPTEYKERGADQTYMFAGFGHLTRHARQLLADAVGRLVDERWSSKCQRKPTCDEGR